MDASRSFCQPLPEDIFAKCFFFTSLFLTGNKYICKDHRSFSFPELSNQKFQFALSPLNQRKHTNKKSRVVIILLVCCNITFICIFLIHSCFSRSGNSGFILHVSVKIDESLAFSITLTQAVKRPLSVISSYCSRLAKINPRSAFLIYITCIYCSSNMAFQPCPRVVQSFFFKLQTLCKNDQIKINVLIYLSIGK